MSAKVDAEMVEWLESIQEYRGLTPIDLRKPIFECGNSPIEQWNIDGTEFPLSSDASFAATSQHFSQYLKKNDTFSAVKDQVQFRFSREIEQEA